MFRIVFFYVTWKTFSICFYFDLAIQYGYGNKVSWGILRVASKNDLNVGHQTIRRISNTPLALSPSISSSASSLNTFIRMGVWKIAHTSLRYHYNIRRPRAAYHARVRTLLSICSRRNDPMGSAFTKFCRRNESTIQIPNVAKHPATRPALVLSDLLTDKLMIPRAFDLDNSQIGILPLNFLTQNCKKDLSKRLNNIKVIPLSFYKKLFWRIFLLWNSYFRGW